MLSWNGSFVECTFTVVPRSKSSDKVYRSITCHPRKSLGASRGPSSSSVSAPVSWHLPRREEEKEKAPTAEEVEKMRTTGKSEKLEFSGCRCTRSILANASRGLVGLVRAIRTKGECICLLAGKGWGNSNWGVKGYFYKKSNQNLLTCILFIMIYLLFIKTKISLTSFQNLLEIYWKYSKDSFLKQHSL